MKLIYEKKRYLDKKDGNLIAYDLERFELLQSKFIDPNLCKDVNYDKDDSFSDEMYYGSTVLMALLKCKITGIKILVTNLHLPYNVNKGHIKLAILTLVLKTHQKMR